MRGQKISKKNWLFMHPRNFGQTSSVRTQRPHPHISGCEMPYLLATVGVQSMFNLIADIQLMVK